MASACSASMRSAKTLESAALVSDQRLRAGSLLEQGECLRGVGLFGAGEGKTDGVAERIDDAVKLSTARAAQSLRAMFFWRRRRVGGHAPPCCRVSLLPNPRRC